MKLMVTISTFRFSLGQYVLIINQKNQMKISNCIYLDFLFFFININRVCVKMKNLVNENVWLWERGKFTNRRFLMQVCHNIVLK